MLTTEQITKLENVLIETEKVIEIKIISLIKEAQKNGNIKRIEAFINALKKLGLEQS